MFRNLKLQTRYTIIILLITIPLLVGSLLFLSNRASTLIGDQANRALKDAHNTIATDVSTWLEQQQRALLQVAKLPDVVGMDPQSQKPALVAMAQAHPNIYLVHTLDLDGINVARNDDADPKDYSDRQYYKSAISGEPISFDVVVGKTSGQPALILAVPIFDDSSNIVGVASIASELSDISENVTSAVLGETGLAFIVDDQNRIVAHPDPTFTTGELSNFSTYYPVSALRQGKVGFVDFTDIEGIKWRAYVSQLDNGWGVVVQQTEAELLAPLRTFQYFTTIITVFGSLILILLSFLMIQRIIAPIKNITETAQAIANGDFSQRITVRGEDEVGQLGIAFNSMTSQIQDLVTALEERVEGRTAELDKRAKQLQAVSEVARSAASLQNLERLLSDSTHLISENFGFYHVGIFLLDEEGENAILRAANSEGGQRMLDRKHTLAVDSNSIVGYAAQTQNARIALDTGTDAVYFDNPDLPETCSEMAIPLKVGPRLIGVLDVQSKQKEAFYEDDISIMSTLGDQLAIAIENTRLLDEARRALVASEQTYQRYFRQVWSQFSRQLDKGGYKYQDGKILPLIEPADDKKESVKTNAKLRIPLFVRGQEIGSLEVQPKNENRNWTREEISLLEATAERAALALESARLLEDAQRRAVRESVISDMTAKIGASTNLESILRTAASELGRQFSDVKVAVELNPDIEQEES